MVSRAKGTGDLKFLFMRVHQLTGENNVDIQDSEYNVRMKDLLSGLRYVTNTSIQIFSLAKT